MDDTRVETLSCAQLLTVAREWEPSQVTVCGFAGSGYSLLTDLLGDDVFVGKDWLTWETPVLVVMGQHLSQPQVEALAQVGVLEPRLMVNQLGIGEAIVITARHDG